MLELRPNCESCDRDLPFDSPDARICSFECTFCAECAERAQRQVSELRRWFGSPSHPARRADVEVSRVNETCPREKSEQLNQTNRSEHT